MAEINFTVKLVNNDDEPLEGFKIIARSTMLLRPHDVSGYTDDDGLAELTLETFIEDEETVNIWVRAYTTPIILHAENLHMGEYTVKDGQEITLTIPDDEYEGTE